MPSSTTFFRARTSAPSRSTVLIFSCLLLSSFFSLCALLLGRSSYRCQKSGPITVRVPWERSSNNNDLVGVDNGNDGLIGDNSGVKRHKVMAFVGIHSGFRSWGRRRSLRLTWMPSDRRGLQRLEESTGLAFRFVIGRTNDESKMAELGKEVEEYDDFMLLDIEDEYSNLPYKTLAFFKAAYALFDSAFYVKADDDIYLRPDRLSLLLAKERSHSQTYIGCMKKGPVFSNPRTKWHEPMSNLFGKEYFLHAYGPIYALSADIVSWLATLRNNSFRMFSNEDVTIGAWMLAMNVKHEHSQALCERECTPSAIAVWDIPQCSGLCDPEKQLLALHKQEKCSKSPTLASDS